MGELEQKFIRMADLYDEINELNSRDMTFDDYCDKYGVGPISKNIELDKVERDADAIAQYTDFNTSRFNCDEPEKAVIENVYARRTYYPGFFVGINWLMIAGVVIWTLMLLIASDNDVKLKSGIKSCIVFGLAILIINAIIWFVIEHNNDSNQLKADNLERQRVYNYNNGEYIKLLDDYNYTQEKIKEAKEKIIDIYTTKINNLKSKYDEWHKLYLDELSGYSNKIAEFNSLVDELHSGKLNPDDMCEIKQMLVTYRVNTLKEAYDVLEQRKHDRRMERQAYEDRRAAEEMREEVRIERIRINNERVAYECDQENARREADRAARIAAEDRERRARAYANACHDYDRKSQNPNIYGTASVAGAKYKRDKAFADLYK